MVTENYLRFVPDVILTFLLISTIRLRQFLDCFTPEDMRFPYGLAIHNDNLYITDTVLNAIFHYKTTTNFSFVSKRGTEKGNSEKFGCPENLTVSTNGRYT